MNAKRICLSLGAILCGFSLHAGGPYYLTADGSSKNNLPFEDPAYWQDKDGGTYAGGGVFDPEGEYFVDSGRVLTAGRGWSTAGNVVFGGKSLTLGDAAAQKNGSLYLYLSNGSNSSGVNPTEVIFSKLILVRGEVNHNYNDNSQNVIRGPVEVRAATVDAFKIVNYYFTCTDEWTGDFTGTENAYLMIGGGARKGFTFKATGSWQDYLGTLTVRKAATPDSPYDTTYRPQTSSSFPGTLSLEEATVLSPLNATDVFTVKNLSLGAGIKIVVNATASASSRIVASDSFSQAGTVALDASKAIPATAAVSDGRTVTLLTVPATATLSKENFLLDDATAAAHGHLFVDDNGDDTQSLKLVFYPVVYQTVTDGGDHKTQMDSSLLVAEHWSDNELPHDRADYQVKPDANNKAVYLHTPKVERYEFPGESLTCYGWCYFYQWCNDFVCKKLTVRNNGMLSLGNGTGGTAYRVSGGELCAEGGVVSLVSWAKQTLEIASELTGAAEVRLPGAHGTSWPEGSTYLMRPNENFVGTLTVTQQIAGTEEKHQTLFIADGRALGGNLAAFDPAALKLTGYGTLATTNAAEIVLADGVNRGVLVSGIGQVLVGRQGDVDTSLVLRRPLTLDGELVKIGTGRLVLDSVVKFGAGSTDAPTAGANRLTVKAGAVQVDGAAAVDGVTLTLDEGTQLLLKVDPSNATRMAQGIRNVKTTTPFVLGANVAKLPLALDLSAVPVADLESGFTCAVLTVAESAADDVEAILPSRLSGPDGAPKGVITRAPGTESGTVTFSATFERRGLMMIFR